MPAATHPRARGSRNLPSVLESQTYRPHDSSSLEVDVLRHPTLLTESWNENKSFSSSNNSLAQSKSSDTPAGLPYKCPSNHRPSNAEEKLRTPADLNVQRLDSNGHERKSSEKTYQTSNSDRTLRDVPHSTPRPPKHEELPRRMVSNWHTPQCIVCDQGLSAKQRVVRTDYGNIHDRCFICRECHEPLEHSEFYFRDSRVLCHLDYHRLYSERCGYCDTPVETEGLMALEKHWHKGHFFCHGCSTPFSETDDYFVTNNEVLCEACHAKKLVIQCWRCKTVCRSAIEALGRMWCSHCFSCEECKNPFASDEFVLREDGTLVCDACEVLRLRRDCWNSTE